MALLGFFYLIFLPPYATDRTQSHSRIEPLLWGTTWDTLPTELQCHGKPYLNPGTHLTIEIVSLLELKEPSKGCSLYFFFTFWQAFQITLVRKQQRNYNFIMKAANYCNVIGTNISSTNYLLAYVSSANFQSRSNYIRTNFVRSILVALIR